MKLDTHQRIDRRLCGTPVFLEVGHSRVSMEAIDCMHADDSGLVHGGFIFGLADYAAMIAVNHPNVVLGAAEVKFLKPVRVGETVTAEARITPSQGKKQVASVAVYRGSEAVFEGRFICFILENHVLAPKP
jgi:uncharacterized protein (TIGR00369 family)